MVGALHRIRARAVPRRASPELTEGPSWTHQLVRALAGDHNRRLPTDNQGGTRLGVGLISEVEFVPLTLLVPAEACCRIRRADGVGLNCASRPNPPIVLDSLMATFGPTKARPVVEWERTGAVGVEVLDVSPRGGIDAHWSTTYTTEASARHAIGQAISRNDATFTLDRRWWVRGGRGHPVIWLVASWAGRVREADWNKNDENREIVTQATAGALGWERNRFRLIGAFSIRGPRATKPWIES
jgi:hypothetical protein